MKPLKIIACTLLALAAAGCTDTTRLTWTRIPASTVYVPFTTQGDWDTWGVGGAMSARIFNRANGAPTGYTYVTQAYTGYGGVLLVCDVFSTPRAYTDCCPVERDRNVNLYIDREENCAKCPKCHSTYDVFFIHGEAPGAPISGEADQYGYGLLNYRVVFNVDGRAALISN